VASPINQASGTSAADATTNSATSSTWTTYLRMRTTGVSPSDAQRVRFAKPIG